MSFPFLCLFVSFPFHCLLVSLSYNCPLLSFPFLFIVLRASAGRGLGVLLWELCSVRPPWCAARDGPRARAGPPAATRHRNRKQTFPSRNNRFRAFPGAQPGTPRRGTLRAHWQAVHSQGCVRAQRAGACGLGRFPPRFARAQTVSSPAARPARHTACVSPCDEDRERVVLMRSVPSRNGLPDRIAVESRTDGSERR